MTVTTKVNKRTVKKSTNPVTVAEVAEVLTPEEETVNLTDLNNLSYRDLQLNAKIHGLKASGTKADLIERLA